MSEQPEGRITDFFESVIQSLILSKITSSSVKSVVFKLIENAEEIAMVTENKIDDYVLDLVKRELDSYWDVWFPCLAAWLGLKLVPKAEGISEEEYAYDPGSYVPESILTPQTSTPGLSSELVVMVLQLVIPYLIKWFQKS